jgi:hypothetical protein
MVKEVAVKGLAARIIGIEGDYDTSGRRDQNSIAHRTREALTVDLDNLELVTVQMHRMRHRMGKTQGVARGREKLRPHRS